MNFYNDMIDNPVVTRIADNFNKYITMIKLSKTYPVQKIQCNDFFFKYNKKFTFQLSFNEFFNI